MDRIIISRDSTLISSQKVLRNTYFMLALTLTVSSIAAITSTMLSLPQPNIIFMLIGFYGLMFLTYRLSDSPSGILAAFSFTGFLGYCLGPILNHFISLGMGGIIALSLSGTAIVFFCCSAYVITTKKNMFFLSGMLMSGVVVLTIMIIANMFLNLSSLQLAISSMFILFSSAAILWETSNIIQGGETNYIRATVSLYSSIYNLFVSMLNIFNFTKNN